MGNVRNVFHVGLLEAQTVQCFEQVAARADALDSCFKDVFGAGFGIDEQCRAFGDVAV